MDKSPVLDSAAGLTDMAIEFNCPHCEHAYRLKDELAGKTATCKTCRNKIQIPQPMTVPDDPPRLTAEQVAEAEAKAAAAFSDEQVAGPDPAEQVIPVECPHCNHKWTEPLARAGKNALCPNPECRQRVKIPEPKKDQIQDWRVKQTNLPSLAKQNAQKLEGVQDAADTTGPSDKTIREFIAPEELEPRSIKRMAMFGFVLLALVGGLVFGVVSLFKTRVEGKEDKLMKEALEEYAQTIGKLPPSEAPAEAPLCSAALSIAAGEYAVRHNEPKKLEEGMGHFAKARDALRKFPPGPTRNAMVSELAVALLVLGGDEQQIRDQHRIRWTPDASIKPRLNERVFTVHEELRLTLTLAQGTEFDFRNHFARRLTRALTKFGQSALAIDLIPLALFAPYEQDEGKAIVALEVYRLEKDSPLVRKVVDELKARGAALAQGSPASAQTLFFALDGDKPRQFLLPPAGDPVSEPARFAYVGKHLLDNQFDEALKLAQRRGSPEGQLRALVLCADWGADPGPALDAGVGLVKVNDRNKAILYSALRLAQIAAEKGRHDQAKDIAKSINDDGLKAWAQGTAAQLRSSAAPNEKPDDSWVETLPAEKLPKDLRAGHAWGRLWVARHNTRLSGDRTGEVKTVGAWPSAYGTFGRAGIALGLQDRVQ